MNTNRRSMGTLKTGLRAQRTNPSTSGPTSANRRSKLPKPASGAPSSSSRGRSGSMDRPRASLAAFSDFKTPRNKSANARTPLSNIHQNSTNRDSRSSLHPPANSMINSMMKRGRSPGKRSSVYGMGGQNKDNRPIGDKNWQKEVVLSLHKFCLDQQGPNGPYPNQALTPKDLFQMSTTTFRTLFDFLYQFLEPEYTLPNSKTQPIHDIMPELLKKLGYPGTVSKSHFQTLGGPSFGNVLGVFHFLLVQAKMVVDVEKNSNLHFFPNRDNEGFDMDPNKPSKQELEYNYLTGAYKEYLQGADTFPELLQEFSYAYSDLLGVDESQIADMENILQHLKVENQRLKDESGDSGALEDQLQKVEDDIKMLEKYICQTEEYIKDKRQSLVQLKEAIRQSEIQTATLQATIRDLERECMVKGIDIKDTANHNEEIIFALQARVEAKKVDLQDVDRMKWDLEQSMSKIVADLDGHKRSFNKKLIGLDDLDQARIFRNTEVDNLPVLIQEKHMQLSAKLERMRKNAEDLKQKMALCTSETIKHEKMERELKKEEKDLNQRKSQLEHEIKFEDEALTLKTKEVKDKLAAYSSKQNKLGSSLKAKEEQLAHLLQEKKEAKKGLDDFVKQSQIFLTDKVEQLQKRKAEEEAKRAQAVKDYEDYEGQLCRNMDKLSKKMNGKLEKMKKM